jgi:hypothetical protein
MSIDPMIEIKALQQNFNYCLNTIANFMSPSIAILGGQKISVAFGHQIG